LQLISSEKLHGALNNKKNFQKSLMVNSLTLNCIVIHASFSSNFKIGFGATIARSIMIVYYDRKIDEMKGKTSSQTYLVSKIAEPVYPAHVVLRIVHPRAPLISVTSTSNHTHRIREMVQFLLLLRSDTNLTTNLFA
jgi:hypothetical protein